MIHPFRDGNGRTARALQTLVLSRQAIIEPAFSSIEEWLGNNTEDYYNVLTVTGRATGDPMARPTCGSPSSFARITCKPKTVARRFDEASAIWAELDQLVAHHGLPERVTSILYEAVLGYRLRRSVYIKATNIEQRTASRDLGRLVDVGVLEPRGETKGRYYVAGEQLRTLRQRGRQKRLPIQDPYTGGLPAILKVQAAEALAEIRFTDQ